MYKSPLLQTPLPQPTRPLPDIWLVDYRLSMRDEVSIGVKGCGVERIPQMVIDAMHELTDGFWNARAADRQRMEEKMPLLLLTLWCRHHEMGYVDYERVPASSATAGPPAAIANT